MHNQTTLTPPCSGLWRLGAAARLAGVPPESLARACRDKRIPVELVELGPRSRFVRVEQFQSWLSARPATDLLGGAQ